jgi:putative oxidoreductase
VISFSSRRVLPVNRTLPEPARDVALLVARLLLGTIMFAHGYQKLMIDGLGRTTQGFESMSIPVAIVSAAFVTVIEIVGGILVILGALLTVVAAFYLVVMVGAAVFVHIPNGVFVEHNGWELVGAIAALLLTLAAAGSGRFGVDHVIRSRQLPGAAVGPAGAGTGIATPPAAAWPTRPVARHDHAARATAFTEVLPRISADGRSTAAPASAAPGPASAAPASPAVPAARAAVPVEPAVSAGPLPVRRPRSDRSTPSPTPHATPDATP